MTFLSLYTGIGLHDLGLERAGHRCAGQIEIDPFCNAVLAKHWPNLPRWQDVRHVTVDAVRERCGRIDLLTGGFACQDVSAAGKGAGLGKHTRSGLTWREMFRLIRGIRPAWLLIENVPALRSRGADRVLGALERIGYACWPVVVGAEHVGGSFAGERVWIVATSLRIGQPPQVQPRRVVETYRKATTDAVGTVRATWPAGPGDVSSIPRMADGLPRGVDGSWRKTSLHALGNANPPQVVELIGRWLALQERSAA